MSIQERPHQLTATGPKSSEEPEVGVRHHLLCIEVPNLGAGLSLINHLARFRTALIQLDETRLAVQVELENGKDGVLSDVLSFAERWLGCVGVPATTAHLGQRVYTISAQ